MFFSISSNLYYWVLYTKLCKYLQPVKVSCITCFFWVNALWYSGYNTLKILDMVIDFYLLIALLGLQHWVQNGLVCKDATWPKCALSVTEPCCQHQSLCYYHPSQFFPHFSSQMGLINVISEYWHVQSEFAYQLLNTEVRDWCMDLVN